MKSRFGLTSGLILNFLFFFIFLCSDIWAVTVSISDIPQTITDQQFEVNVSVTGAQNNTINYLKISLYPPSTTKYFGYTYNNSNFYNGPDYINYLPVTIDSSGNWSGKVIGKIDPGSSYFTGSGTYNIKVKRFTAGGSELWSNESSLNISSNSQPTATPIPTNSPASNNTSTETTTNNSNIFSISGNSSNIKSTDNLTLKVELSLPSNANTTYYLKGAFYKDGESNYFGKTKVSGSWIKNSQSATSQFPITTDGSGNWSGNIEIMPDTEDSGYKGSGSYKLKVGKYNSAGESLTWSNDVTINIENISNSTANPTSTAKPSTTTKPTSNPDPTNKSSASASGALISSKSAINKDQYKIPDLSTDDKSNVLGKSSIATTKIKSHHSINWFFISAGFIILILIGSLLYKKYFKGKLFYGI